MTTTQPSSLSQSSTPDRFTFRSLQPGDDASPLPGQMHALRRACAARDQVDPFSLLEGVPNAQQIRAQAADALAANQADRWQLAFLDNELAGYTRFLSWREDDGAWVYLSVGWVDPQFRGQGLGTALLEWAESRIRQNAAQEHPGEKAEFAANASSTEHDSTALLLASGYTAAYSVLEFGLDAATPVPLQPLPPGFDLRPVDPHQLPLIAQTVLDCYAGEYENGRFIESPDLQDYLEDLRGPRHDLSLWQAAWSGDRLAGQVLPVVENSRAEIFEVSVHPDFRRCGLARALLSHAIHALRQRDVEQIRLYTNAFFRTRARDLYESAGFRLLKEFPRYRKPF